MMNSDKPNFLSQPVVKNIFVYRNGDPYYEGRRIVINEKRVSNFETFLKEVTGGVQAQFGAVRTIYTPKAGHRVSSLEHLQSGEQYVAAGKEKFKKLDYLHIGTKKKKMQQSNGQVKPVPQSRIIVSARFLKPIKEPCTIFVLANGDVLSQPVRFLIPQRILDQKSRVLEMITEKMGRKILGGARSLYTLDGTVINEGMDLENGQFYVAVGYEKFKKLPYSELIFSKPVGTRKFVGSKAASLPPIYRFRKQNGNQVGRDQSKSIVSNSEAGDSKSSPPSQQNKEHLASIVSELSQARLLKLRQKKSGMTMSLGGQSNDDGEQGATENPGDSSGSHEVEPPKGSKDDASAEEKQNSEETKDTEGSTKSVTDAEEKDEEVEKPTKDEDVRKKQNSEETKDTEGSTKSVTDAEEKDEEVEKPTKDEDVRKKQNSEETKDTEGSTKSVTDAEEKDEEVEKPTKDEDVRKVEQNEEQNGEKHKSEEKSDSRSPTVEGKEEKSEDTCDKLEEETEEAKPEDGEADNKDQSGEGETSTVKNSEAVCKDQGEEGQGSVTQDKPKEEKAGSSETKEENDKEEEKSDQIQGETENKGGEESGGHKGSEKEDQVGKKENK